MRERASKSAVKLVSSTALGRAQLTVPVSQTKVSGGKEHNEVACQRRESPCNVSLLQMETAAESG